MFYCVINKESVSVTFDTPSCCCKINNPSVYEDISQDAPILIPFIMYSTMCRRTFLKEETEARIFGKPENVWENEDMEVGIFRTYSPAH